MALFEIGLPRADGPLNDPATTYHLKDGGYVVRNDKTGVITQTSKCCK